MASSIDLVLAFVQLNRRLLYSKARKICVDCDDARKAYHIIGPLKNDSCSKIVLIFSGVVWPTIGRKLPASARLVIEVGSQNRDVFDQSW